MGGEFEAVLVLGAVSGLEVAVFRVVFEVGVAAFHEVHEGQQAVLDSLLVEDQRELEGEVDGEDDLHHLSLKR